MFAYSCADITNPNETFSSKHHSPGGPGGRSESFSIGSSMSRRVIQLPDGSVEEHSSTRNSDGTERITVTRRFGDQSHTETTVRRPDGTEERTVSGSDDFDRAWAEKRPTIRENGPHPDIGVWKRKRQSNEESLFDQFFGQGPRHPPR